MLEVLAPVGNLQSLKAAIYAGADAVYLGLDLFNARIKADNFHKENIKECVEYCHLFGVKVYVAFNINVKQSEMQLFADYAEVAAKAKVDAFIVTDLGCMDILRKYDIPLHASTQIGVHNLAGAKILESLGFTRVVLARETLYRDICEIKRSTSLEIEHFVHGALCVSFSGACLMSSMMSGDSGNRGRCNQPCRLKYTSDYTQQESYLLSPKDQCLIDKIPQFADMGIDSLKIEGRLKQPHYVGIAVAQYRKAVDAYINNTKAKIDYFSLKTAYNRGNFTLGYNYENTKSIMYNKVNGHIGENVGKIIGYANKKLRIKSDNVLNNGDGIKIINNGKEIGGLSVSNIARCGNNIYAIYSQQKFETGSEVCLTSVKSDIDKYNNIKPKLSIKLLLKAEIGNKVELTAEYGDICVKVYGSVVEAARNRAMNADDIIAQLSRLGESNFDAEIYCEILENQSIFIPQSALNALRRDCLNALTNEILERYDLSRQRAVHNSEAVVLPLNIKKNQCKIFVEINGDKHQIAGLELLNSKINLVLPVNNNTSEILDIILQNQIIKKYIENIYLRPPRVARGEDYCIIDKILNDNSQKFDGLVAENIYGVYLARKYNKSVIGGIGLNIYNDSYSKNVGLCDAIASVELTANELPCESLVYAYGPLPVMTLLHCPIQVNTGCDCSDCKYCGDFYYYDKKEKYRVSRYKLNNCVFTLFNPYNIDIRNKLSKLDCKFYINAQDISGKTLTSLVEDFANRKGVSDEKTTSGHLFRGVK